jgi:hypothetical protein
MARHRNPDRDDRVGPPGRGRLFSFSVSRQRRRFGVCVLLILGLYAVIGGRGFVNVAYASRTFFGTYRVIADPQHPSFTLFHGTTIHGRQNIGSDEPLTYYHRDSPIAQIFATRPAPMTSVGAVGLGTGTLAAYATPGQQWTFYEIDPKSNGLPGIRGTSHTWPRADRDAAS